MQRWACTVITCALHHQRPVRTELLLLLTSPLPQTPDTLEIPVGKLQSGSCAGCGDQMTGGAAAGAPQGTSSSHNCLGSLQNSGRATSDVTHVCMTKYAKSSLQIQVTTSQQRERCVMLSCATGCQGAKTAPMASDESQTYPITAWLAESQTKHAQLSAYGVFVCRVLWL